MKNNIRRVFVFLMIAFITGVATFTTVGVNETIVAEAASKIKLSKTKVSIYVGKSIQLKVSGTKEKVLWESSNNKVASVTQDGLVSGIKKGTVMIRAQVGGKVLVCEVKVYNQVISSTSLILADGDTEKVAVKGSIGKVAWKSSNKAVATVDSYGKIKAIKEGSAIITATNNGKKYNCKVTVVKRKLQVTTNDITCYYDSQIMITSFDSQTDEIITSDVEDGSIISCEFGEWVGDNIPLIIKVKKYGSTKVTLTSSLSKQKLVINVTVIDSKNLDDSNTLTAKEIYKKVSPSTVQINTDISIGSGFFIDKGVIVTNYHVVVGAKMIKVQTHDGESYVVDKVLGYNRDLDIAILSVKYNNSTSLVVNRHGVTIGDLVYTLGSSLGLTNTFSNGIVSNNFQLIDDVYYIQTTAPISSGNSGGPLINSYGEVIGINTMSYVDGQNINMSIEINQIYQISLDSPMTVAEFNKKTDIFSRLITFTTQNEDASPIIDIDDAQVISIDTKLQGTMKSGEEYDFYKIVISEKGYYVTFLDIENDSDFGQVLYGLADGEGEYLKTKYSSIRGTMLYELHYLTPGTYYIVTFSNDADGEVQYITGYFNLPME